MSFPLTSPFATGVPLAIVIPAKNEAFSLERSLPALQQALERFPNPYQILLIDDGSTDTTAAIAQAHGVRVYPGDCRGPGAARNLGAEMAQAWLSEQPCGGQGWLLFLDADCQVSPDHFEVVLPAFGKPGNKLIAVQERAHFRFRLQTWGSALKRLFQKGLCRRYSLPMVHAGCLYVQASAFRVLQGFNPDYLCEDIELGLRVGARHLHVLHRPIVAEISDRRLHRLGVLSTLGIPARCTAMLFLSRHVFPSPAAQALHRAFAKLGPAQVPISLWWHDPEQRLQITWGEALRLTWLWFCLLVALECKLIRPFPERPLFPERRALPISDGAISIRPYDTVVH